jgi:hypothetical protein
MDSAVPSPFASCRTAFPTHPNQSPIGPDNCAPARSYAPRTARPSSGQSGVRTSSPTATDEPMQNSNTNANRIYASMPHLHPKDYAGHSTKQSRGEVFHEIHKSNLPNRRAPERGDRSGPPPKRTIRGTFRSRTHGSLIVRTSFGLRKEPPRTVLAAIDLKIAKLCQKLRLERALRLPSLTEGSERFPPFCRPGPGPGCLSSRSRGCVLARTTAPEHQSKSPAADDWDCLRDGERVLSRTGCRTL